MSDAPDIVGFQQRQDDYAPTITPPQRAAFAFDPTQPRDAEGLWRSVNAGGDDIADVGKTIPRKREAGAVLEEWLAPASEFAAARALAAEKARNVPKPSDEDIAKNMAMLEAAKDGGRAGGWGRGNSYTRRARGEALFEEFGGKKGGYCPCGHCGIKVSPRGEGGFAKMQQDKILVASEGGTYGTVAQGFPNLIPSCGGCNSARADTPFDVRPLWMEDDAVVAAAGSATGSVDGSDRYVAEVATGKAVGWDVPELQADGEVTGEYVVRSTTTWFGTYEQHLVGGETCDEATIEVAADTAR